MRKRPLGTTGVEVPVIMLGGNVFGWTVGEGDAFRLLDAAFDAGLTSIDTADIYPRWVPGNTGGESEAIIGKWFARSGKRDQVFLATKVGMDMGGGRQGLSARHIEQSIDDSLRRLQTDRVDLYQSHIDDEKTPLEETLGAYDRLIRKGKVRFIGASNYSGARLRAALATSRRSNLPRCQTLQPLYNLLEREPYESELAPAVREFGLSVIPYSSLAGGFLTGKYRTEADLKDAPRGAAVRKYLNPRGLAVLDALRSVAAEYGVTPASVALGWLLSHPEITAPIASATSTQQLAELVEAGNLRLDTWAVEKLTAASDAVVV